MKRMCIAAVFYSAFVLAGGTPLVNLETYDVSRIVPMDFTAPLWVTPKPVKTDGIKVEKVKTENGFALDVRITDDSLLNPGILLPPPKGETYWDLSRYQHLCADIENMDDDQQIIVSIRVTNPLVGKRQIANNSGFGLNPKEKRTLKLYYPQADEFAKCRIDGLRATPPGVPGLKNIDGRRVDAIIFWGHNLAVYSRKHSAHYRISNIRLEKPYTGPGAPVNDPDRFYPFIDRYGQYVHQDWPDKIHSDADFAKRLDKEKRSLKPRIADWNKWGGWLKGPQLKATGFFRTEKYQGKWFLVDPEGRLFFSHGINAITPNALGRERDPKWYETGKIGRKNYNFNFINDNLKRKYGADYQNVYWDFVGKRLQSWGINTIGNWSCTEVQQKHHTPYAMELRLVGGKKWIPKVEGFRKFRDVFDPDFEQVLRNSTKAPAAAAAKNDPWCIGFFICNEIKWGDRTAIARSAFSASADNASKKEFVEMLETKYITAAALNRKWGTDYRNWNEVLNSTALPDPEKSFEDMLAFNIHFLDRFYFLCRKTVKEFSPNHLYLGSRLHLFWHPEAYAAAAKYADIVSRNIYSWSMDGFRAAGLPKDKPIMITEFHVGVLDRGTFNADMRPSGVTQDDRAHAYLRIMQGILLHPQVVGAHYFCWNNQPLTGRFDGENLAIGVIDCCDTPFWELTAMMRKISENMMQYRLDGKYECGWDQ